MKSAMAEQSSRRCDACDYWQAWDQIGLCRFNPPVQIRDVRNDMVERWPPVAPDDWCGQFQPRNKAGPDTKNAAPDTKPDTFALALEDEF
jgi:hypothetical protein